MRVKDSHNLAYQLDSNTTKTTCHPLFINVLHWYLVEESKKHRKKNNTPSSSAKLGKQTAQDAVQSVLFTRIQGRPTRQDYELLKKEASDLASKVDNLTFAWSCDPTTEEEYGLLAEIIGNVEYVHLTNQTWTLAVEPVSYDPGITAATVTHQRKRMEEEWEEKQESWCIRKGFLRGVTINMRDALDEQYYSQLKHVNTAYHNTSPIQVLGHLDTCWCPLDVQARKMLKKEF